MHLHLWSCSLDYRWSRRRISISYSSYFYSARILTCRLFFLLQTPLPATQITVGRRDLQYFQQCLFRPLFFITQVCRSSWFDTHVEWHLKELPSTGVFSLIFCRIILDEAALFLSDKANAVSINLARGTWATTMIEKKQIELWPMYVFDLVIDYVQVVDMGTLELRITAAKPGADGKLVKNKNIIYLNVYIYAYI